MIGSENLFSIYESYAGFCILFFCFLKYNKAADNIEQIYVYPPTLSADKTGSTYTITGSVAEDEIIAVEMVGNKDAFGMMPGVWSTTTDLQSKTASANIWYDLPYTAALILNYLAKAIVLLVPLLLLLIYYRYGRERKFTVTTYLSTIPNPALKPWQVNLLFKGDALDFDKDGYYATLLDLHRRKLAPRTRTPPPALGGQSQQPGPVGGENVAPLPAAPASLSASTGRD